MHAGKLLASHRDQDGTYMLMEFESVAAGEREYRRLATGGTVLMPLTGTSFGLHVAMLRDRFGTSWILVCPDTMETPCASR